MKELSIYIFYRYQGKAELRRNVPDSITSWMLTAFSVNDAHGLGLIEEPRKVFIHIYTICVRKTLTFNSSHSACII